MRTKPRPAGARVKITPQMVRVAAEVFMDRFDEVDRGTVTFSEVAKKALTAALGSHRSDV